MHAGSFGTQLWINAQAQCWKGSSSHKTAIYAVECCNAMLYIVATESAGFSLMMNVQLHNWHG